jgi:uncharacterized protein (TIRG00374 family)
VVITRYSLPLYSEFKRRFARFVERPLLRPFLRYLEKFLGAVAAYASLPARDLLLAITAGVISALTGIVSGTVLANSIGIPISFLHMGWIQAVIMLATQLPFAVAGGVGIREVTLVAILATFGVSAELALALSFLLLLRGFLQGLLGGVVEAVNTVRTKRLAAVKPAPGDIEEL